MRVEYAPVVIQAIKKTDVRVKNSFKSAIEIFHKNPYSPLLNNHDLREEYEGCRSINITSDYRAIYQIVTHGNRKVAFFVAFGTHKELYK